MMTITYFQTVFTPAQIIRFIESPVAVVDYRGLRENSDPVPLSEHISTTHPEIFCTNKQKGIRGSEKTFDNPAQTAPKNGGT